MTNDQSDKNWVETSASIAPAALGAAVGMFVGDLIHREARRPIAFTLAAVGLCAFAPALVEAVVEKINGPNTNRGSKRTLRNIRDAGIGTDEYSEIEDEYNDQMYVG